MRDHTKLIAFELADEMALLTYMVTKFFPKEEIYGLTSQIKRSAISIPSNIAEGSRRSSKKDFRNFLLIAYGSGSELETQIEISKKLNFSNSENFKIVEDLLLQIMKMLNKLCNNLR